MATRYEDVSVEVEGIVEKITGEKFPELDGAFLKIVFDTKKKVSNGKISIARIKKLNDESKFLALTPEGLEYDYMIMIDKQVWEALDERDRERIVFHELCHTQVDSGKENPYGIKDHEINGFYAESEYNDDDPRWAERVSLVAASVHDPENEGGELVEGEVTFTKE